MNKQEAIKAIEQDKIQVGRFTEITREVNAIQRKIEMVDYVPLETVVSMIDKINESQKVPVPKFVADWVDNSREYSFDFDDWLDYENQPPKVYCWLNPENKRQAELNTLALVTLIVNGANAVEIEKEKLYTVEIEGISSGKLFKNIQTNKYLFHSGNGLKGYTDRLTEKEIKEADERLWQWAKPVEDE